MPATNKFQTRGQIISARSLLKNYLPAGTGLPPTPAIAGQLAAITADAIVIRQGDREEKVALGERR